MSSAARVDLTNSHFNYPELDRSERHIRLLTIDRYGGDGAHRRPMLECSLHLKSLASSSHYCALSYTWGLEAPEHTIRVDGVAFKIRCNLFNFLTTIGFDKYRGVPIFIDAICIDQSNLEERGQQVSLMKDVYAEAAEVIAWLSPVLVPKASASARVFKSTAEYVTARTEALFFQQNDRMLNHRNAMAFSRAYLNPFWTRLWIVQEILLAKNLTLHIGEVVITCDELLDWKRSSQYQRQWLGAIGAESDSIADLVLRDFFRCYFPDFRIESIILQKRNFTRNSVAGRQLHLYEALTTYGGQRCSQPWDIVYGLLGLAESHVLPDYTLRLSHLYVYVLIEGLHEIATALPSKADESKRGKRQMGFVGACMRAFGYSATQLAVFHLTRTVIQRSDMDEGEFIGCWNSLLASQRSELLRPRSLSERLQFLVPVLDVVHFLQTCVLFVVPDWVRLLSSPPYAVFLMLRYALLDIIMFYLEETDCTLSMPDGEKCTFAEWTNVVDYLVDLHDQERPPSNIPDDEETPLSSDAPLTRASIFTHTITGTVIDWTAQAAMSIGLAWLGVKVGAWVDLKAALLISWVLRGAKNLFYR